jgi:D-alanyl-D-alanine carboxypeptidase
VIAILVRASIVAGFLVGACVRSSSSTTPQWTTFDDDARAFEALARKTGFAGVALVGTGDLLTLYRPFGSASPTISDARYAPDARWRWASVTKQVVAVLIMEEVARGTIDLTAPVSRYLPKFGSANADSVSVEQLLRHQSGLPNP